MIDPTDLDRSAPRPWTLLAVGTQSGSGGFHLFVVDANGRKIGVIWGKRDEKMHTGSLLVDAVNGLEGSPPIDASIDDIGAALRAIKERA